MNKVPLSLRINGLEYEVLVRPEQSLLSVLRDTLGLTGTKTNCIEAECGVCSVLIDGNAVNSCIFLAQQAQGHEITTIEGIEDAEGLDIIQEAFIEQGAVQCGYCIPGMIIVAKGILNRNPRPTRDEIREGISGVLCRCTGYQKIINAIDAASSRMVQEERVL